MPFARKKRIMGAPSGSRAAGCGRKTNDTGGNPDEESCQGSGAGGRAGAGADLRGVAEERPAEYLSAYYNVSFEGEVTVEAFNDALSALGEPAVEGDADAGRRVVAAVKLADMDELALSYVNADAPDKAANVLAEEGVTVDEAYQPYVACALDLDLVDDDADFAGAVSAEQAAELLYKAAEMAGMGRHYIGRVSDDDILTVLRSTLDSFIIFDEETLSNLGTEIVLRARRRATTSSTRAIAPISWRSTRSSTATAITFMPRS